MRAAIAWGDLPGGCERCQDLHMPPGTPCPGAEPAIDLGMSERHFQLLVLERARELGWLAYHTHDSRRSAAGFPDLTLVHLETGKLMFVELKTERENPTPPQRQWLEALQRGGHFAECWKPSDWPRAHALLAAGLEAQNAPRRT
ncbi:MAG TPA: VRR-NUC domain-containing protein [Thermoleophilia bacterium]|nr:VRR-NUC domain-containing protein [Thermoleophilia bacterium]